MPPGPWASPALRLRFGRRWRTGSCRRSRPGRRRRLRVRWRVHLRHGAGARCRLAVLDGERVAGKFQTGPLPAAPAPASSRPQDPGRSATGPEAARCGACPWTPLDGPWACGGPGAARTRLAKETATRARRGAAGILIRPVGGFKPGTGRLALRLLRRVRASPVLAVLPLHAAQAFDREALELCGQLLVPEELRQSAQHFLR